MNKSKDILALVYLSGSDREMEQLRAVLEELLKAVHPEDQYPAIVRKRPTTEFPSRHVHIMASFNKMTKDALEDALKLVMGTSYEISYTSEYPKLNRTTEINEVVKNLQSRIQPIVDPDHVFGPITREQAALEAAASAAALELYYQERDEAMRRQAEQDEMDHYDPDHFYD